MYQFTDEELRKLQLKNLDLLLYFKQICDENHLLFYFCGGCCIGAIRHKGFIPWDDDIDVFMPREDYEKLKIIWNKKADTEKYSLLYANENMVNHNLFITISDNDTTFIRPYQEDLNTNHGIVLDILPLDGFPKSAIKRKMQMFWALIYSLYCAQIIATKHGCIIKYISKILLLSVPIKGLRFKIWKFAEKKMSQYQIKDCEYVTELCAGPHYMKNRYPKVAFEKAIFKDFEGHEMPIPVGYHTYLSIAFGDYMQLPPLEKRKTHHDVVFCDLDNSYKKYKGKYYCVKENGK